MARTSTKENKSVYQLKREELGLSREQAAGLLEFISEDRLYRIEHDDLKPHPDEVLLMADKYKDPSLCNHYCSKHCQIGCQNSFEVEIKDLPTIVLQTVASLNSLDKHKERFIEIAADCQIDETELNDFHEIQEALKKISIAVESLRLWAEQMEIESIKESTQSK